MVWGLFEGSQSLFLERIGIAWRAWRTISTVEVIFYFSQFGPTWATDFMFIVELFQELLSQSMGDHDSNSTPLLGGCSSVNHLTSQLSKWYLNRCVNTCWNHYLQSINWTAWLIRSVDHDWVCFFRLKVHIKARKCECKNFRCSL